MLNERQTQQRRYVISTILAFLATMLLGGSTPAETPQVAASGDGWISLFDGESLAGWSIKCRPEDSDKRGYWRVENGTITARGVSKTKHDYKDIKIRPLSSATPRIRKGDG